MSDREAGTRLRRYIEGVMAERGIASVSDLARRSHVSRDTFQQWWRGRPPQRGTAELVCQELGVTYSELLAAREGFVGAAASDDTSGTAALVTALTAQTAAISRLVEVLSRLTLPNAQEQAEMREALAGFVHETGGTPLPRPPESHRQPTGQLRRDRPGSEPSAPPPSEGIRP